MRTTARKPPTWAFLLISDSSKAPFRGLFINAFFAMSTPGQNGKTPPWGCTPAGGAAARLLVLDRQLLAARAKGVGAVPADVAEVGLLEHFALREGFAAPCALRRLLAFVDVLVFLVHIGLLGYCWLRSVHAFNKASEHG